MIDSWPWTCPQHAWVLFSAEDPYSICRHLQSFHVHSTGGIQLGPKPYHGGTRPGSVWMDDRRVSSWHSSTSSVQLQSPLYTSLHLCCLFGTADDPLGKVLCRALPSDTAHLPKSWSLHSRLAEQMPVNTKLLLPTCYFDFVSHVEWYF